MKQFLVRELKASVSEAIEYGVMRAPFGALLRCLSHHLTRKGRFNALTLGESVIRPAALSNNLLGRICAEIHQAETEFIVRKYHQSGSAERCIGRFPTAPTRCGRVNIPRSVPNFASSDPVTPSFSILIPYHTHFRHFKECVRTLAKVEDIESAEVIVVNDEPGQDPQMLRELFDQRFPCRSVVLHNQMNLGIVRTLNRGIRQADGDWIVFLDCDDLLERSALRTVSSYISRFPGVRYITSCMTDIDSESRVIRRRSRRHPATNFLDLGMTAGHLKCIRKDVFWDYGFLEPAFSGCQDYEFALRLSHFEEILAIPEYLYRYRWHPKSQSVGHAGRQDSTAHDIRDLYRWLYYLRECEDVSTVDGHLNDLASRVQLEEISLKDMVAKIPR